MTCLHVKFYTLSGIHNQPERYAGHCPLCQRDDAVSKLDDLLATSALTEDNFQTMMLEHQEERAALQSRLSSVLDAVRAIDRYMRGDQTWEHGVMGSDDLTPAKYVQEFIVERRESK